MCYVDLALGLNRWFWLVVDAWRVSPGLKIGSFGAKSGEILRDGMAVGRGVHRKMGVPIQKSRSLFGGSGLKLRKIRISGVGVV